MMSLLTGLTDVVYGLYNDNLTANVFASQK